MSHKHVVVRTRHHFEKKAHPSRRHDEPSAPTHAHTHAQTNADHEARRRLRDETLACEGDRTRSKTSEETLKETLKKAPKEGACQCGHKEVVSPVLSSRTLALKRACALVFLVAMSRWCVLAALQACACAMACLTLMGHAVIAMACHNRTHHCVRSSVGPLAILGDLRLCHEM